MPNTVKVLFNEDYTADGGAKAHYQAGEVYELREDTAQHFLGRGVNCEIVRATGEPDPSAPTPLGPAASFVASQKKPKKASPAAAAVAAPVPAAAPVHAPAAAPAPQPAAPAPAPVPAPAPQPAPAPAPAPQPAAPAKK